MTNDLLLLMPLIIVGAGAILLMLSSAYEKISHEMAAYGSALVFAIAFLVQLGSCITGKAVLFSDIFNSFLVVTNFSKAAGLIILACGLFTVMSAQTYFKQNTFCSPEFYSLTVFAASGMLLLTMAQELISVFIALEIMSLAIYILVGYNRKNVISTEAVLKYLMLGAFAGAFLTMGTALVYGATASTKFVAIGKFVAAHGFLHTPALVGGAFFILVAFLFKVAAFPFHAWVVDVYDGASVPITGYMATGLKTAIFAVFANFLVVDQGLHSGWITFLFYISILTMFVGNLIAIGQQSLKRMLAASGIVHSGYLLIALVAVSSQEFSGSVIAYYLAAYAAGTLGIFCALSYLGGAEEKRNTFDDFKGLAKIRPYSAAAISVFLLSMAGIPPTAGFMGKFYIITSAIDAGQITLAVLGIISSIISMWYYLRLIINMYFHEPEEQFDEPLPSNFAPVCTFILVLCVFAISLYPITV
ncbi:proton-translocating NADH-quinone oxidoreductase, chain N [Desulfobulbus propionicus DSM 2032]|uniref:NADH-quinone oxidoreductase subunit N n=1 Tax=Desulfobulbus propionicus (strain ATCC 33891 / DSM 2032 / VKM B-1956 / 1pr3) TaxID=577650 RepID=A0A7U3YMN0_DESPD|nr:NADH-quinone oxidoreductase subunit N [Desulfobulbus propionicus]ADW18198.1 proton-translocating NADH-quinone oxidoreductase, chain N [Desulfobulbus propionicus DSM 2032]